MCPILQDSQCTKLPNPQVNWNLLVMISSNGIKLGIRTLRVLLDLIADFR